jgi:hypothetical protein
METTFMAQLTRTLSHNARNVARRIGPLRKIIRRSRITKRLRELDTVLHLTFREHLDVDRVRADYAYSLEAGDRQCVQMLLLEDIITMLAREGVHGALVECGVFTGGASAFMLRSAMRNFEPLPPYWGFDSFQGMPHATPVDGPKAVTWLVDGTPLDGKLEPTTVNRADCETVTRYLKDTGYPHVTMVPGWFQNTLAAYRAAVGPISLLRLDGDFYESTKVCLNELAEQVVPGGVIVFDDYGAFEGCKKAADEFLSGDRRFSPILWFDAHQTWTMRVDR